MNGYSVVGLVLCCTALQGSPNDGEAPAQAGMLVALPVGSLRLTVDDDKKPFKLENLDKRFDAPALKAFLDLYVPKANEQKRQVAIIVKYATKGDVPREAEFNAHLKQLAEKYGVTIVYLPMPTGADPDRELREFAEAIERAKGKYKGVSMHAETRMTDAEAQLILPKAFANATVIVEHVSDTELRVRMRNAILDDELLVDEKSAAPLSRADRDRFLALIENPPAPTAALRKAANRHKARHA